MFSMYVVGCHNVYPMLYACNGLIKCCVVRAVIHNYNHVCSIDGQPKDPS